MEAGAVLHLLPSGERHLGSSHSRSNKLKACHNQQPVPWHHVRITLSSVKALAREPDATSREGLNFSPDLYQGLAFEETASNFPIPFATSLCFCFLCSTDQSDSHKDQNTGLTGNCHDQEVQMDDGLPIHGPLHAHLENFSAAWSSRYGVPKQLPMDWQIYAWLIQSSSFVTPTVASEPGTVAQKSLYCHLS